MTVCLLGIQFALPKYFLHLNKEGKKVKGRELFQELLKQRTRGSLSYRGTSALGSGFF